MNMFPCSELITFRVRRSQGEMYIGHGRLCVCLSVCLSVPPRVPTLLHELGRKLGEWYGVHSSCALLGGFAIGAQHGFRCYDNIAPNAKCQRVLVLALCLVQFSLVAGPFTPTNRPEVNYSQDYSHG